MSRKDHWELRFWAAIKGDCIQTLCPTKLFPWRIFNTSLFNPQCQFNQVSLSCSPFTLTHLVPFLFSFLFSFFLTLYSLPFHFPFDRFSQKLQASLICRVTLSQPAVPWESFKLFCCTSFHLSFHSPLDRLPHCVPISPSLFTFPSSIFSVSTQY